MKPLQIGDKLAKLPLIQGGMGVGSQSLTSGRSRGSHWRHRHHIHCPDWISGSRFPERYKSCQSACYGGRTKKARDIAADADGKCQGLIGYNIMVATKDYADYVKTAAHAGAM